MAALPRFILDKIASGDAGGAGQVLLRMFQGEWGGRATLATLEALNTLVQQAGCRVEVRAAFAGAVAELELVWLMTCLQCCGVRLKRLLCSRK